MRLAFFFAVLLLLACQDAETPYRKPIAAAPTVSASPQPGVYAAKELRVEIRAPSDDFLLWFAVDELPEPVKRESFYGKVQLTLRRSGQIRVLAADPQGHIWGPYDFTYELNNSGGVALCRVSTERTLLKAAQPVEVDIGYYRATELDLLYLSVDGVEREVGLDELDEQNTLRFTGGPWSEDGVHEFGCRIKGPWPYTQNIEVTVDATPPSAGWIGETKTFGRADWPVDLRMWASDAKSGLADVQVCSAVGCIAPFGLGNGVFQHATAFTAGTNFQVAVTAAVRDQVGNVTLLDPITFGIVFDEPPGLPLSPITATTMAVISIFDYVPLPVGTTMEIRRTGDFFTNLAPESLALQPGWNDFIFRRDGKTDWESFAVYRLGFSAQLPAGNDRWLAFASNSTLPAVNGWFVGDVTGSEFRAGWWNVPHLWFVRDVDGDGAWSDADSICAPSDDSYSGPWAREALPWTWQVQPSDCHEQGALAPEQSFFVSCSDCSDNGRLFLESRSGWFDFPAYHGAATLVTAALLQAGVAVTFPAQTEPLCLLFWDENSNAIVDGQDPRVFAPCDASSYQLTRRNGALRAEAGAGSMLAVGGIAYGGAAWATLVLTNGTEVVSRRSLGSVNDIDGTGEATVVIPSDVPPVWSWTVEVTDSVSSALPVALPKAGTGGLTEIVWTRILDDYGLPFTGSAAVLLMSSNEIAGGMYSGNGQPLALPVSSLALGWSGLAMREGFVSVAAPVAGTDVTLYVLSQQSAGLLAGQVRDSLERPVPFANISWNAPPYSSRAVADADGNFSIPALGLGSLWAEGPEPGQAVSQFFHMESYSHVGDLALRLPGKGDNGAVGLVGDAGTPWIEGTEPVETVILPPYYHAAVTAGAWTQVVGPMQRRFVYPGYLPSYISYPFQTVAAPPSLGADLKQYVACGDRRQHVGAGGTLQIDALCWRWYAENNQDTYFLGLIDLSYVIDSTERFGKVRIEIQNGEGAVLVLSDRLWGRKLRMSLTDTPIGKVAEGTVAVGVYDVSQVDGTSLVDGAGRPARISVGAGVESSYFLRKP